MTVLPVLPRIAILAATGATTLVAGLALPAFAHAQGDRAFGSIASVSGSTFEVNGTGGTTQVAFTDATNVSEAAPAERDAITVGSCLKAGSGDNSAPANSSAITAKWVMISTAVDGKCPQRPATDGAAPRAGHGGVRGVVTAVAGDTVTVSRQDDSTVTVTLTDDTHYRTRTSTDAQAIAQGKCVAARGEKDANGVLQATNVTVWTTSDGNCPSPAR